MTTITFYKTNGIYYGFEEQGHTGFAESGDDILCSALSAMTMLIINAIEVIQKIIKNERLNDTNLKASKDNDNIVYDEYDIRKALTKGIE
jgi:uncharacterized protein YsxB (DUF464 family)